MKILVYITSIISLIALIVLDIVMVQSLFYRFIFPLLFCMLICLIRIVKGPTAADRTVAIDILGIVIVGFCAIFALFTGRAFLMDIALAWALQSFIGVLALAKYLEGRLFDA